MSPQDADETTPTTAGDTTDSMPVLSNPSTSQQQQQAAVVNNRFTSTVKKEQLEYEFRLRPRTVVYKSFNNTMNSKCIKRKKNSKKNSKTQKGEF